MTQAFTLNGFVKRYRNFTLGTVDLSLEPGTVLALVGANGAGKTTLMAGLVGVIRPEEGEVRIFGEVAGTAHAKRRLGYVSETRSYYEEWSGERNLRFLSRFYPNWSVERMETLIRRLEFPLEKPVRTLSKGNRVKLSLIAALSYNPALLLLDEPTAGLDPLVRAELLELLWELLEEGESAILYATHMLSDVSRLADTLAFLRNGQLVAHTEKVTLEESWRQVSFKLPTLPALPDVVSNSK